MRPVLAALVLMTASTALADPDDDFVVVNRERVTQRLTHINDRLSAAVGRARRDHQLMEMLKSIRADLDDVRDHLASAPSPYDDRFRHGHHDRDWDHDGDRDRDHDRDRDRDHDRDRDAYNQPPPSYPPNNGYAQPAPPPAPPANTIPPGTAPINEQSFRSLLASISNESFGDNRLRVLQEASPHHYFVVAQVQALLQQFQFPKEKLVAMRTLKPRIIDMDNSFRLYASFDFANDKAELQRILNTP